MTVENQIKEMVEEYLPKLEEFVRDNYNVKIDLSVNVIPDKTIQDLKEISPKYGLVFNISKTLIKEGYIGFYHGEEEDPKKIKEIKKSFEKEGKDPSAIIDSLTKKDRRIRWKRKNQKSKSMKSRQARSPGKKRS